MVVVVIVVVDVVVVGTVELVLLLGVVTVLPTAAGVTVRVKVLGARKKAFVEALVVTLHITDLVKFALPNTIDPTTAARGDVAVSIDVMAAFGVAVVLTAVVAVAVS